MELTEPEYPERIPLAMLLVNNPHGDVLVCGYGTHLPKAQSIGVGEFLRPYIRDNTPANYLLQYKSRELTFEGFSGGAVYSMVANAVVGLQIESSDQSDQVLAMPLSRIPEFWEELTSVAQYGARGQCVVLVPADSDDRLYDEIIKPVLDDLHLDTYVSTKGATDPGDLEKLDVADIVIADATLDDAFVTRELTLAQGLGTPDIVVRSGVPPSRPDRIHSSVLYLQTSEPATARTALKARLLQAMDLYDAVGELVSQNPITSFFGVPLTQVSAANALALGYFENFVSPVGHALGLVAVGTDIVIKVDDEVVDARRFTSIALQVVLPTRLDWATEGGSKMRRQLQKTAVQVASVNSTALSRERRLSALRGWEDSERLTLLDIFPTTMATLIDSIDERFADRHDRGGEYWRAIERKEIDRFSRGVSRRIRTDRFDASPLQLEEICTVVTFSEAFPDFQA
ncbi:MAG TPA: STING domain-containing protein [Dermatophilaceae bacterium]|nr:STING domain-containing protein [Dermatophilaceae bacterium]